MMPALDAQLEEHITRLSSELPLPPQMRSKDRGAYTLRFSGTLQVELTIEDNMVRYRGLLGSLPASQLESFLVYVSFANLFGEGTGNSVISLDNAGKLLYLSRYLSSPLSYTRFQDELESFVNFLEIWQKKCTDASSVEVQYTNGILQPPGASP